MLEIMYLMHLPPAFAGPNQANETLSDSQRQSMRYLAQGEHVLKSLNLLLSYLYSLSYLSFPSFSLFATRWIIQYAWLALQKEVAKHQVRWAVIPFTLLVMSVWIHSTRVPGAPIILDFIGQPKPQALSFILLLDLVIAFLELLVAAIFYEHVITYTNVLNGKPSHHHRRLDGSKSYTTRRVNFVLDIPLAIFVKLSFNPKSLLAEPTRPRRPVAPGATRDGEEDAFLGTSTGVRLAGLPLPFNLGSAAPNRAAAAENPIPGALMRDW